jgi:hypothetical protein
MYHCTICNESIDPDEITQHMTLTHHVTVYSILNLVLNEISGIKERIKHLEKFYYKGK